MIFSGNRAELRSMYASAWKKHRSEELLSPLESQLAAVIAEHPEYHAAVADKLQRDYPIEGGETNPFLHMGLHLGIREQVATNRPPGIAAIFRQLAAATGDKHAAEHRMIDCLAETLWEAQNRQAEPDEQQYLERLHRLTA